MSLLSIPAPPPVVAESPHPDPLVRRLLALASTPDATPNDAAELRIRGMVRAGRAWAPVRAVDVVAPRTGYLLRARVLGLLRLVEEQRGDAATCRVALGGLVEEDDSMDARRHARTHRAVAALWVPGALRPQDGARWHRVDATHLRLAVDDLELTVHVHPQGHVLGMETLGWGHALGAGAPGWFPLGYDVYEWRTFGSVTIPATVAVSWFPGTARAREIARLQVTAWAPRTAEAFR
jgi:hypothetical protein